MLKNIISEQQFSVESFLIWLSFLKVYLVNERVIFVGLFLLSGDSFERNSHMGLISDQN